MCINTAKVAAELTRVAAQFSQRRDIVVTCSADPDHPLGLFTFARAEITMNVVRLLPEGVDTTKPLWWVDYPQLMGCLTHELGHAEHTPRRAVPAHLRAWVNLLEEPRIERIALENHPTTADWLRCSATASLCVRQPTSVADAAETLILACGRRAAGVLTDEDIAQVTAPAERMFPPATLRRLCTRITEGVALDDDDDDGMLQIAASIAALIDDLSEQSGQQPSGPADHDLTENDPGHPSTGAESTPPPTELLPPDVDDHSAAETGIDTAISDSHANMVTAARPVTTTVRAPRSEEIQAAQALGSWLTGPSTTRLVRRGVARCAPPGQMRMQEALRSEAQQDLGLQMTATPWTRQQLITDATAPFEVATIIDRSLSMQPHLDDVAGAVWVLGRALGLSEAGRACTWVFSDFAEVLPLGDHGKVVLPRVGSGSSGLPAALADYQRWTKSSSAVPRVLAILSDGALRSSPISPILDRIERSGVRIVWCAPTLGSLRQSGRHHSARTAGVVLGGDLIQTLLSATSPESAVMFK